MTSQRANLDRSASRWAVSVVLAIVIHVVVIVAAWPFVRPLMLRAFGPAKPWKPVAAESVDVDSPIITGTISTGASAVEEPDYVSRPWDHVEVVAPANAHLPFSFARTLRPLGSSAIDLPPRRAIGRPIAPQR